MDIKGIQQMEVGSCCCQSCNLDRLAQERLQALLEKEISKSWQAKVNTAPINYTPEYNNRRKIFVYLL